MKASTSSSKTSLSTRVSERLSTCKDNLHATLDVDNLLGIMRRGEQFLVITQVLHANTKNIDVIEDVCRVWYEDGKSLLGSLKWTPLTNRGNNNNAQKPVFSLSLSTIQDVYLGSQCLASLTPTARKFNDEQCVSMTGEPFSFHAEASSVEGLTAWLFGIDYLISRTLQQHEGQVSQPSSAPLPPPLPSTESLTDGSTDMKKKKKKQPKEKLDMSNNFNHETPSTAESNPAHPPQRILQPVDNNVTASQQQPSRHSMLPAPSTERTKMAPEEIVTTFGNESSRSSMSSNNERAELIEMMIQGRRFHRYFVNASGTRSKATITLFYNREEHSLFWSDIGTRTQTPQNSMKLQQIRDIMLGKQTSTLKSKLADDAPIANCFSVKDSKQCLELEAFTTEQASGWLYALQTLLTKGGKKMNVNRTGKSKMRPSEQIQHDKAVASAETARPKDRRPNTRYSILPPPSNDRTKMRPEDVVTFYGERRDSTAAKDFVEMMIQGRRFYRYSFDAHNNPIRSGITLFYNAENHTLYWCAVSTRVCDPQNSLSLIHLTDIMLGKQSPVLKTSIAATAKTENCFSLKDVRQCLELEAFSTELASGWLFGLQTVLTKGGKKMNVKRTGNNKKRPSEQARYEQTPNTMVAPPMPTERRQNNRLSILPPPTSERTKMKPEDIVTSYGTRRNSLSSIAERSEFVEMMTQGRRFYRYSIDANNNPLRTGITLFYNQENHTLYWCPVGSRIQSPQNSLSLAQLTDIMLGKQTPMLQSLIAESAPLENCFALKDDSQYLELEAFSTEQASGWLFALQAVIEEDIEAPAEELATEQPPTKSRRRFSIVGTNRQSLTAPLPPLPALPPQALPSLMPLPSSSQPPLPLSAPKPLPKLPNVDIPTEQESPAVTLMSNPRSFYWYKTNQTGEIERLPISLWYSARDHSLLYAPLTSLCASLPPLVFPLKSLRQVILGKQTKTLRSKAASAALNVRCASLLNATGSGLEIEGVSGEAMSVWLYGLQQLLTNTGKQIIVDTPEQHRNRMMSATLQ